ncbi:dnaJ homolog subfamily C member 24 [Austrofundulus limnaeus]|uniref:DnaJ homolog subfamily C member 24 n=1 Tax=Austrofundulus limnaeus TaxID=52670 RepID=A0A2I4CU36_AUSLI|nr:PREDICTED: dnaJ homolog subfamily C member 24 [Austrofundulus limnaeus]XP_013883495.1 PREDICTED: dnaJ homolog subfamily C member 24 [Austrofundulus limnaeus]
MCEPEKKDLYAVLGASPSDSVQQLKHKYQQLALKYHPDRLGEDLSTETESAVSRFVEVNSAWKVLGEQNTRRQYDSQRREQELKQDRPVDSTVQLEDMMWDQDEGVYTYDCRCGGGFLVSQEEVEEETLLLLSDHDDEEMLRKKTGVLVCCDTCSLGIWVTWSLNKKTESFK